MNEEHNEQWPWHRVPTIEERDSLVIGVAVVTKFLTDALTGLVRLDEPMSLGEIRANLGAAVGALNGTLEHDAANAEITTYEEAVV